MPEANYYRWRHHHPKEAECECNCQGRAAAYAAGVKAGRQDMLEESTQWVQLAPLLGSLLEELAHQREERETERAFVDLEPAF